MKANGDLNWAKIIGDSNKTDNTYAVVFDEASESIFVGGYSQGFDISNSRDMLVSKLDKMGNLEWVKLYGGGGNNIVYKLQLGRQGRILVLGVTNDQTIGG